jgi:hypothetical protein
MLVAALEQKAPFNPFVPGRQAIPPSLRSEIQRRRIEAQRLSTPLTGHQSLTP